MSKYLERVHIDIVSPMPMKSVGGREYAYVVVDDYTYTSCTGASIVGVNVGFKIDHR